MKATLFFIEGRQVEVPEQFRHLIKAKYRKELAAEYGLSEGVFRRRVKKLRIDIGPRGYLDETHVLRLYLSMGWPCRMSS